VVESRLNAIWQTKLARRECRHRYSLGDDSIVEGRSLHLPLATKVRFQIKVLSPLASYPESLGYCFDAIVPKWSSECLYTDSSRW